MTFQDFQKLDIRTLSEKAQRVIEESDQSIYEYIKDCQTVEEINSILEDF